MNRAIVMSLQGKKAVVLAPGGRFLKVPSRNQWQVGDEIDLEEGTETSGIRRIARRRTWAAGSAACAAAALVLLAGSLWLRTPSVVAYVSMDVNPSIEFGLDSKERVLELHALNRDAEPIVAELKFKGKDIGEVAEEIAEELAERHILNGGDSEVVLASVAVKKVDSEWEAEVAEKMKQAIEKAGTTEPADPADSNGQETNAGEGASSGEDEPEKSVPEVTTLSLPKEVREEAKENGLSAGKMAFWLKAESQGHDLSIDQLKHNSLKKIAASWGGVRHVFGGNDPSSSAGGASDWKQLLKDTKTKEQQQAKDKSKTKNSSNDKTESNTKNDSKTKNSSKNEDKSKDESKSKGKDITVGIPAKPTGAYGSSAGGKAGSSDKRGEGSSKNKPKGNVPSKSKGQGQDAGDKRSGSDDGKEKTEAAKGFGFGAGFVQGFGWPQATSNDRDDKDDDSRGSQESKDRK